MSLGKVRSCYRRQMPVPYPTPNVECYTWTPSHHHLCLSAGAQITSLRMTSSCPDYLHAGVSDYLHAGVIDAGDVSLHKQEMTDAQLVTVSRCSRLSCGIRVSPLQPPSRGGTLSPSFLAEINQQQKRCFDW